MSCGVEQPHMAFAHADEQAVAGFVELRRVVRREVHAQDARAVVFELFLEMRAVGQRIGVYEFLRHEIGRKRDLSLLRECERSRQRKQNQ